MGELRLEWTEMTSTLGDGQHQELDESTPPLLLLFDFGLEQQHSLQQIHVGSGILLPSMPQMILSPLN